MIIKVFGAIKSELESQILTNCEWHNIIILLRIIWRFFTFFKRSEKNNNFNLHFWVTNL